MNLTGQYAGKARTRKDPTQCWRFLILLSILSTIAVITSGRLRAGPNKNNDDEPTPLLRVDFETGSDAAGRNLNNGEVSLFSTFHGGSSPEWTPRDEDGNYRTVTAYFDNIEVYPGKHVRKPIPPNTGDRRLP